MTIARNASGLIGRSYHVRRSDLHFSRDFTVIDESVDCLRLQNSVETYWVTKIRFLRELGARFVKAKS